MTTQITSLPLNALRIDEAANVRKIGRGADKDFVASIKAIGIQMPLIVRKNGKGYVIADGGKRFEAAQHLVKKGDWKADAPISVIDATGLSDAEAREISLALNLIRADMHPVDAYRAFSALHTDKEKPLDVEAIATRFGIDAKVVRQRLALGAVDEVILNAWLKDDIDQRAVEAFTLQPDKAAQVALFNKLKKNRMLQPWTIKSEIKAGQNNVATMLATVTQKAYEARGGKVTQDLFGTDMIVTDFALLQTMLEEKLTETVAQLQKDGWSWVETTRPENHYEYGRIQPEFKPTADEKAKLAKLKKAIAKAEDDDDYEAQEKAMAEEEDLRNTILSRGITDTHRKKGGCFVTVDNGAISVNIGWIKPAEKPAERKATGKAASKDAAKPKPTGALTNAMRDRLNEQRRTAIRSALVAHPHKDALARLAAGLVSQEIRASSRYSWATGGIMKAEDSLIAAIDPKVMNAALHKAFDAKDYFNGCGKALCLAAISEAVNADEARKLNSKKKAEIAKFAIANVGKTKWLPKELRAPPYDGPVAKKAAKKKR